MISKLRFFVAVAVAIGVAAGTALAARPEVVELNLTPSSAQLAACMPNARVDVTVRLTTDLRGFDVFHVHAVGLPPNTTFTAFLLEQVGAWFADPTGDDFCLGPDSPVTPFDGDNEAGVQAFNSANTTPLPPP